MLHHQDKIGSTHSSCEVSQPKTSGGSVHSKPYQRPLHPLLIPFETTEYSVCTRGIDSQQLQPDIRRRRWATYT